MKTIALVAFLLSVAIVQSQDAETHKAWMNDATDLQEDVRDAMRAKSGANVAAAATKLEI